MVAALAAAAGWRAAFEDGHGGYLAFFSSFGIAKRLYMLAFLLTIALGIVAFYANAKLGLVSAAADKTGATRVPQLQRMAALELNVTRVSLQIRHGILSRTPEELSVTLADIGSKRKLIEQAISDYDKAITTVGGRERFERLKPLVDKFWQFGEPNIKLIQDGQKAEAFAFLVDKTIPARNELLAAIGDSVKFQEATLHDELAHIRDDASMTLKVLVTMVLASIAGLILFAWSIARVLRRRVATSQAVAEYVRDGDLTRAVHDSTRDEFSPLLGALGAMQLSLTQVVAGVRSSAEGVATASAQIAQGNADLSQRTETQASALQQTAASMEELSATVRQNADNAKQANQLAHGASTVAVKGGTVVNQVVDTMRGINDSSRKIVDIISVIDGIAFQTNILALNAAVEAARAGEQGRGFAVVAAEVRSLAQRSAEAAKEIKSLITASVQRVEQGTVLVDEAGTTMQEVVSSIKRVTDIMGEISSASVEQSSGVAQVGEAVTQMDRATQQNAALVEESAAAAASLSTQAQQLLEAVGVFKLGHGAAPGALSDARQARGKAGPARLPTLATSV